MPIYINSQDEEDFKDKLKFESVEDYDEYSTMVKRIVQLYSSDKEITNDNTVGGLFISNSYSYDQPDEDSGSGSLISFDTDYKSIDARYKCGTGFLIKKDLVITTIENIQLLLNIPARFRTEKQKREFIDAAISQGKLLCRRAYDKKETKVQSVSDYEFEIGWVKLNLYDKFGFNDEVDMDDEADDLFSDDYLPMNPQYNLQMFGHPLGIKQIYRSSGYVYELMPKYSDSTKDPMYKYCNSVLSFFPGSSGSPVFNSNGIFVGICTETARDNHFTKSSSSSYKLTREDIKYNKDPNIPPPAGLLKIILKNRLRIL